MDRGGWGRFKNVYELVNLGALKSSLLNKLNIFQRMGGISQGTFQSVPLKFHTKYLTHTLRETSFVDVQNLRAPRFTSSFSNTKMSSVFNPLRAKFFRGNINIYLHFVSYLHIDTTQVVEIFPQIREEPAYAT